MSRRQLNEKRRKRLLKRALPLAIVAIVAFAVGVAVGQRPSAATQAAEAYAAAWVEQDFATMHAQLSPASRQAIPAEEFAAALRDAQRVATVESITFVRSGEERGVGDAKVVPVEMRIQTRAFGTIDGPLQVTYLEGGIEWGETLLFPGLRDGETLASDIELPERAPIVSGDGVPLAEGPALARSSPLGPAALDVTGTVGSPDEEAQKELAELGLPADTPVGINGLEKAYNEVLLGTPGGRLLARSGNGQDRVIAETAPRPAPPLITTIDSDIQLAAVSALAGRSGGIVALDARNGAVRAMAGQAYSAPQPPGSTYKVLTTVAALEQKLVKLDDYYEPVQGTYVAGRYIRNAASSYCGGDFREVFAKSCNSAFLPLGPELGNQAMVEIAERFGFNSPPQIFNRAGTEAIGPPQSTIPTDMTHEEELAVSAIGQGRVLATPLQMASVAQTIASGGVRAPTPIARAAELRPEMKKARVVPRRIANIVRDLMVGVVTNGTGYAAAIPAAQVAGKTGTAELGPKPDQGDLGPDEQPEQMLDAWFIGFAPAKDPKLAVAVMLINADADGGAVAAPAAGQVLAAGLAD